MIELISLAAMLVAQECPNIAPWKAIRSTTVPAEIPCAPAPIHAKSRAAIVRELRRTSTPIDGGRGLIERARGR
ncbi:hypothetical protein GUG40_15430 [Xanthomonas citri pv. citri]|uniref:hypothetical protein n=1 Tax=Xanthomonas citri TaxID=346 RepID=UPI00174C9968|nr:hypothetical protein [Xanthomonas citri]MBD4618546.1 hypothetical protein [Xanthomonas citri pv. citri]MBD4626595.1 hypothetical protein [Xanthomonas citri pv. citri]MBD4659611.1 hypothetical protein [Xanthomonas citri pv. citri]MBD4664238.1 hypothetical protein [Xanthomonas citri pv. citri]